MKTIKKNASLFYICLISLALCSCASVQPLVIEVRKPAQVTLPLDIAKVIVVNNSLPQPSGIGITQTYDGEVIKENSLKTDFTQEAVKSLYDNLNKSKFFNEISPALTSIRKDGEWIQEYAPISTDIKKYLADSLAFDGIITLDRLLFSVDEKVKNNIPGINMDYSSHYIDMKILAQANGSIYSYNQEKPLHIFSVSDSVIVKNTFYEDKLITLNNIPEAFMKDLAKDLGAEIAKTILPTWIKKERYIYTGANARMKEAFSYTKNNYWKSAQDIWTNEYAKKTKESDKGKIANNIAIAYEIEDKLEDALKWALISQKHFSDSKMHPNSIEITHINSYIKDLHIRIKDDSLLNLQMGM